MQGVGELEALFSVLTEEEDGKHFSGHFHQHLHWCSRWQHQHTFVFVERNRWKYFSFAFGPKSLSLWHFCKVLMRFLQTTQITEVLEWPQLVGVCHHNQQQHFIGDVFGFSWSHSCSTSAAVGLWLRLLMLWPVCRRLIRGKMLLITQEHWSSDCVSDRTCLSEDRRPGLCHSSWRNHQVCPHVAFETFHWKWSFFCKMN